jgi:hypothetical protein
VQAPQASRADPVQAAAEPVLTHTATFARVNRVFALVTLALAGLLATLALAQPAAAHHQTPMKGMWGPLDFEGRSAFPLYHRLGVGVFEMTLDWRATAGTRPADPTDPADPAYAWPESIDTAVERGRRHGIAVSLLVIWAPPWANGGKPPNWAPTSAADLADFLTAAARRYPGVHRWMVWGEPTRQPNFMPLDPETPGKRLTRAEGRAARKYARMLDAGYAALKAVNRRNLVIGGNSFTTGDISPRNWIRSMRLRDGRRPRMDLYGHNPFTARRPDLAHPLVNPPTGWADFSDLDTMFEWLDRHGYRDSRGRRMRIFVSEFYFPTDHPNREINFYVGRRLQARWVRDVLRIVRATPRIATLGWLSLVDDPPRADGLEVNRGLIDQQGRRKPAFRAFRRG